MATIAATDNMAENPSSEPNESNEQSNVVPIEQPNELSLASGPLSEPLLTSSELPSTSDNISVNLLSPSESEFEKCMEYKFISGSRVSSVLLYVVEEKQLYVKNRKLKFGGHSYVCRVKNCNTRVHFHDEKCVISTNDCSRHEMHANQEDEYKRLEQLQNIRSAVSKPAVLKQRSRIREVFNENAKE